MFYFNDMEKIQNIYFHKMEKNQFGDRLEIIHYMQKCQKFKKVLWIPFGNRRPLISSLYNISRWNKNRNSNEERCMKIKLLHCACVTEIIHHGVSAMFLDHRAVGTTGSRGAITPPDFSLNLSQTFPFKKTLDHRTCHPTQIF